MRRCPLIVVSLLALWMAGDRAIPTLNATAQQDNCDLRHRKDNPDLQRAKEAKKAQLRARGYPERFMKLIDREECIACVETASDAFHIMIIYKDNAYAPVDSTGRRWTQHSHAWDPESEIEARERTADGTIEGFYIFNTAAKDCICCGDTAAGHRTPQSYSDWDENLSANKDHLIPFDRSNIGSMPDDLQHPDDKWIGAGPLPVVRTFNKPNKKQAHAACPACEASVAALNAAYDALDTLWDDKIANLNARQQLELDLAKNENESRTLWYQQRSAAMRSDANQKRIEDLETQERALHDRIRAGVDALDAIEAKIEAAQPNIAALEKAAAECTARCTTAVTTPTPSAAVNTAAPAAMPSAVPPAAAPTPPPAAAPPPPAPKAVTPVAPAPPVDPEFPENLKAECAACESAATAARESYKRVAAADRAIANDTAQIEALQANKTQLAQKLAAAEKSGDAFAAAIRQELNSVDDDFVSAQSARLFHQSERNTSNEAYEKAVAALEECNRKCHTTAADNTATPDCYGDACGNYWTNCASSGTCKPVDTDCGIPGVCSDGPGGTYPVIDLSNDTAWTTSARVEIEIRVQDKLVDILDPPQFPQYNQPTFMDRFIPERRNATAPIPWRGVVIPESGVPRVGNWLNPLGLLARTLTEHIERWRGSMGPRPLITTRDLEAIDRVSGAQAAGLPAGVHVLLMDQGGSTGKTLAMSVLNFSGHPVQLSSKPFAVQPIKQQAQQAVQQAFNKLAKSAPVRLDLTAYCVEMLKAPPGAQTLLRLAPANLQQKYAPMSKVLQSAFRVAKANALHPDSNPAAYTDSIKQWSLWTVEQKLNEQRFTDAFLALTKKNVEAAGQQWSKQADDAVHKASPNRWRDITTILRGAGVAVPQ